MLLFIFWLKHKLFTKGNGRNMVMLPHFEVVVVVIGIKHTVYNFE